MSVLTNLKLQTAGLIESLAMSIGMTSLRASFEESKLCTLSNSPLPGLCHVVIDNVNPF